MALINISSNELGRVNWAWFDFNPFIHGLKFKDINLIQHIWVEEEQG